MNSIIYIRDEIKKLPELNEGTRWLYNDKFNELLLEMDVEFLNYVFYNERKYIHEETEECVKRRDDKFRKEVKRRYKSCIITGKSVRICEVAHIVPFSESTKFEKYDPDNGILLCRELHNLFDTKSYDLKINPDTQCIELSDEILLDEGFQDYHQYNGKQLKVRLDENTIKYLRQKYY